MNDLFDNWIYENSPDNEQRYVLGEKGDNPLICIGVNPSTAEPGKLDPTLRQVKSRSKQFGFDGWIMLNLYPQRATNPDDLSEHLNLFSAKENIEQISKYMNHYNPLNIWAAWGTLIEKRHYLVECLQGIRSVLKTFGEGPLSIVNMFTIGKRSQKGHPHHPLYLSKDAEVCPFNLNKYIEKFE